MVALTKPSRSTVAMAIGAAWNSRAKSELGGAGLLEFSGRAIEDERVREPPRGAAARQPMQDARRQARAVGFDEVDVEAPRRALGRSARLRSDQRGVVLRHDRSELERPACDFRQVEPEPLSERGIEVVDIAIGVGGEEAGRRAVEIGDRRLHFGEARLGAGALERNLVDLPHHEPALAA